MDTLKTLIEIQNQLNAVVDYLDNVQAIKENHSNAMQDVEYRISDILHLIELNDIPLKKLIDAVR